MILPQAINSLFPTSDGWHITTNEIGHSEAQIFILSQNKQSHFVLKCEQKTSAHKLKEEFQTLTWLAGRFPAPRAHWYREIDDGAYLLMDHLPGYPAFQYPEREKIGSLLGQTLNAIHQVPFTDFYDQENKTMALLKSRLGTEADKQALSNWQSGPWDLVFSHGDYCLPNVLFLENQLSGIIDLGDAGIYDRYHDLFWCHWSLGYNQLEDQILAFWEAYGIDEINTKKLSFMAYINQISHDL
jgi:aminoglycoside phosphotransferase